MHRHRSLVLVPALLIAGACSRGDDASQAGSPLDRDLTLSAQLQGADAQPSATPELASNGACERQPTPRTPSASQRAQAVALEQRAAEAEFTGNITVARDLHRQAARLDGTSEEIAYRLARADEASGDSAAAVKGYCRYLSLAPSAANARDVRARLGALLPSATTRVATQTTGAPTVSPAVQPAFRASRASGHRSAGTYAVATAPAATSAPTESGDTTGGTSESASVSTVSSGDVVESDVPATVAPEPAAPASEPVARRGADHTARDAAIGAAAGAAVGAMTSRSVKGAVIGGVAGGVLGAVVGRASRGSSSFRTPGWAH